MQKQIKEIKKSIWNRRHNKFPHLIEISIVYKLLDAFSKTQAVPTEQSPNRNLSKSAYIRCKTPSCMREVNKEGDYCGICRGV